MNKAELIVNIAKQANIAAVKEKAPDVPKGKKDKSISTDVLKTKKPIQNQVK